MTLKQKVVAAIDFGTHGTGYAWAVINDQNRDAKHRRMFLRTQWPSQPVAYPKNLTSLLIDNNGEIISWGFDAKRQWHVRRDQDGLRYLHGFKMWLMAEGTTSEATGTERGSAYAAERAERLGPV